MGGAPWVLEKKSNDFGTITNGSVDAMDRVVYSQ